MGSKSYNRINWKNCRKSILWSILWIINLWLQMQDPDWRKYPSTQDVQEVFWESVQFSQFGAQAFFYLLIIYRCKLSLTGKKSSCSLFSRCFLEVRVYRLRSIKMKLKDNSGSRQNMRYLWLNIENNLIGRLFYEKIKNT